MSDPESLVPAAEILEHSEIVDCWNAVDGHVDLVAKLNAPPSGLIEEIESLGGVEGVEILELAEESGSIICNPSFCYSFVFLEVEPAKSHQIRGKLSAFEQVVFTSSREDGAEIIAVVHGASFQSINRIVDEQIRTIDGVLRLKQDRVISLKNI